MPEALKKITFSNNHNNKLNGTYFTAIGLCNDYAIWDIVDVYLKEGWMKKVQVINKYKMLLQNIPDIVTLLDSGLSQEDFSAKLQDKFKNDNYDWETKPIYVYLFKSLK